MKNVRKLFLVGDLTNLKKNFKWMVVPEDPKENEKKEPQKGSPNEKSNKKM